MDAIEECLGLLPVVGKGKISAAWEIEAPVHPIEKIVIAGAGQAGGRAAEALRAASFGGSITVIGEEKHPPYERPQLSKELLATPDAPVAYLKSAGDWASVLDVTMITGAAVVACDPERQTVATGDGKLFGYDRLLLATGTQPRRIKTFAGTDARVHYLRNIEDALHLRQSFHRRSRVVIIGGGVIGLEAACAAAKHGCEVTVVESQPRLLVRAFPGLVSDVVEARHRNHGVRFEFGVTVAEGTTNGVRLTNGAELKADIILVGIGVDPTSAIARDLGLSADTGIAVDALGRTAAPNVFSAGDVSLQWSRCHDRAIRVETWANAQNQAICVAGNMIGTDREYGDPPWFWSDQYDLNIQVVGDMLNADHIVRGDSGSDRFSVAAMRGNEIVGAISINAAKDMAMFRRMVARQSRLNRSDIESTAYDLRQALKIS
jgi:NADPH-dependent 2,4-dienoyl-CoA reductase/sulfur reductase-like enzyme